MRKINDLREKYEEGYLEFANKLIKEADKKVSNHEPHALDFVDRAIAATDVAARILSK